MYDVGGERVGVYAIDGATVTHNKVHDCVNVNIYVSASENVVVDGNWSYTAGETWNNPDGQHVVALSWPSRPTTPARAIRSPTSS